LVLVFVQKSLLTDTVYVSAGYRETTALGQSSLSTSSCLKGCGWVGRAAKHDQHLTLGTTRSRQKCRCRAGKPHCRSIRLGDCAETGVNFTGLLKVAEKSQLSVVHTSACSSHCRRHAAHPHSNVNVDDQQYNQEVSELMSTYSVNLDD